MASSETFELPSPTAGDAARAAPFPLPLTPFEYYYWCDDTADYPTAFPVNIEFTGTFERDALQWAVNQALARQPMLSARIDLSGRWPRWVAGTPDAPIDWRDAASPIRHARGPRLDLTREQGFRAFVRESPGRTRLQFHFHHACCDGLAGIDFSQQILLEYCRRIGTLAEPPRAIEPAQLATRGEFLEPGELPPPSLRVALRDLRITIGEWSKLMSQNAAAIAPPASAASAAPEAPADIMLDDLDFATHYLSGEQLQQLRSIAQKQDVSQNDLLLRDMFLCLSAWNAGHGDQKNRWLRILMPVDLRSRRDRTMPATNRMSFSFVTRRAAECLRESELLRQIERDTELIRQGKLGLYFFVGGLASAAGIRGAIPWALGRRRAFATVCLSNLGRVFGRSPLPRRDGRFVCGSAVMESLTGVPPIRPFTHAALAIFHYDQKLAISVRCDPRLFTPTDTSAFLAAYVAQLEETIRRGR